MGLPRWIRPLIFAQLLLASYAAELLGDEGSDDQETCRKDRQELYDVVLDPVPLEEPQDRPRTIVVAGLGGGTMCGNSHDWRSDLPRYLGAQTNSTVIVFYRNDRCRYCWRPEDPHGPDDPRTPSTKEPGCLQVMQEGVDLLMIVGSGKVYRRNSECNADGSGCPRRYHDLMRVMLRPWIKKTKRIVHFPIRALPSLTENKVFNFDGIIDDNSFPKPVGRCAVDMLRKCQSAHKANDIMYVGRLTEGKGQLHFLKNADPQVLNGLRVRMFGRHDDYGYVRKVREVAEARGINITLRKAVSKDVLFHSLCSARGLVMVSDDKNPRVVYEAITAGLPVLVSAEAQAATILKDQDWFVETSLNKTTNGMNDDLRRFIAHVRQDSSMRIKSWADANLSSRGVYLALCQRMGLCRASGGAKFVVAKNEELARWTRTWAPGSLRKSSTTSRGRGSLSRAKYVIRGGKKYLIAKNRPKGMSSRPTISGSRPRSGPDVRLSPMTQYHGEDLWAEEGDQYRDGDDAE